MRVAFGTDEVTALTEVIKEELGSQGHQVVVVGEGIAWPDAGRAVAEEVASGRAERGVTATGPNTRER